MGENFEVLAGYSTARHSITDGFESVEERKGRRKKYGVCGGEVSAKSILQPYYKGFSKSFFPLLKHRMMEHDIRGSIGFRITKRHFFNWKNLWPGEVRSMNWSYRG